VGTQYVHFLLISYSFSERWHPGNHILTEEDRDNIRAFKLKIMSNMSRKTFNQMRYTFKNKLEIDSEWVILHRLAVLADVEPVYYDCCINSCMAYTGQYEHHEACDYCRQPRYGKKRRSRRVFMYLPLIPRLQAMFQSKEKIGFLSYRHQFEHEPGRIRDVFDGSHYRSLLRSKVVVDGVERPYHYFSGKDDIALALSVDGYLLFQQQRRGPSATPILGQIFNLPPQIRCHFQELLSLGIIPGPRLPKDYASFMVPVDNELAELAYGVQTFNAIDGLLFDLHAYCIQKHGDIVAIERLLGLKGHSSFRPCRSCRMTGVRDITGRGTIYYIPLRTPIAAHQERPSVDPRALPPRTKCHFDADAKKLEAITSATARDDAAKLCGISRRPALRRVGALIQQSHAHGSGCISSAKTLVRT
jgi:Transposase family tnp2